MKFRSIGCVVIFSYLAAGEARAGDDRSRAVQLIASHSNKCIAVGDRASANEAPVVQVACDSSDERQRWRVERAGGDLHRIVAENGHCLDVYGEDKKDGARIITWPCKKTGNDGNQLWKIEGGRHEASLIASHSGRCLDVAGNSRDERARVIQYRCTKAKNQRFAMTPIKDAPKPIDRLVGDWAWFNGIIVSVRSDGTMHGTNRERGRWEVENAARRTYVLRWDAGWIDRLTMSDDHNALSGTNNHGTRVTAFRKGTKPRFERTEPPRVTVRDCGTGPDDPGCNTEKDGMFPADAETFQGFLAIAKAQRSQIVLRDQALDVLGPHKLTARQFGIVLDLFRSEIDRMRVAKGLAKNVVDPSRALAFADKWRSSINQREYTQLMARMK